MINLIDLSESKDIQKTLLNESIKFLMDYCVFDKIDS